MIIKLAKFNTEQTEGIKRVLRNEEDQENYCNVSHLK